MRVTWIKTSFLIFASVLFAILVAELILASMGKYDDLVTTELTPSNTVWTRPPNSRSSRKHPDLDLRINLEYDEYGLRNESGVSVIEFNNPIGIFGDSLTENRRVKDEFSISGLLNKYWKDNVIINFGVDGFGVDQSYQRYLNLKDKVNIKHVVYIFSTNDLRNLYEVDLFSIDRINGRIVLTNKHSIDPSFKTRIIRAIGKLRVTYLSIEAYHKTKRKISSHLAQKQTFRKVFGATDKEQIRNLRFHDQYADGIVSDMLANSTSSSTKEWAEKFSLILDAWRKSVEDSGAEFHIAILPRREDKKLLKKIIGDDAYKNFNLIKLMWPVSFRYINNYSCRFKNDDHWSEMGNLAAVPSVAQYFHEYGYPLTQDVNEFLRLTMDEINSFYSSNGGRPYADVGHTIDY